MTDVDANRLTDLVLAALERTVLVLADPVDEPPTEPAAFAARTRFEGFTEGEVLLCCDAGFACEAAAGLLGSEPDEVDADVEGRQILDELANIVGGSVITALGGDHHPYRQHLPERIDVDAAAPTPGDVTTTLRSEDGWMTVTWRALDAGRAAA